MWRVMFESKYIMYKTVQNCSMCSQIWIIKLPYPRGTTRNKRTVFFALVNKRKAGEARLVRGHLKHRSLIPLGRAQHLCKLRAFMFFHLNLPQKLIFWIPTLFGPTGNSTLTQLDKNSHLPISIGPLWLRNKVHLSHIKSLQGVSTWPSFPLPAL